MLLTERQNHWRRPANGVLVQAKERKRRMQDNILRRLWTGTRRCVSCSRMIWANGNRDAPQRKTIWRTKNQRTLLRAKQGMQHWFKLELFALPVNWKWKWVKVPDWARDCMRLPNKFLHVMKNVRCYSICDLSFFSPFFWQVQSPEVEDSAISGFILHSLVSILTDWSWRSLWDPDVSIQLAFACCKLMVISCVETYRFLMPLTISRELSVLTCVVARFVVRT